MKGKKTSKNKEVYGKSSGSCYRKGSYSKKAPNKPASRRNKKK